MMRRLWAPVAAVLLVWAPVAAGLVARPSSPRRRVSARQSLPSLVEVASLEHFDVAARSTTLEVASFQDLRDGVAGVVRPLWVFAALPAFGLALIPVTLATAVTRKLQDSGDVLASVPRGAWLKLALCVAVDVVGDASGALPSGGARSLAEAALGPLDFLVLRFLFEGSFVLPAVGLLEEWLPFVPDTLPLATLAWCLETLVPETPLARALGLGDAKEEQRRG